MEEKTPVTVPYFLHEGEMARAERTIKRMQILCGIMAAALLLTNAAWALHIF